MREELNRLIREERAIYGANIIKERYTETISKEIDCGDCDGCLGGFDKWGPLPPSGSCSNPKIKIEQLEHVHSRLQEAPYTQSVMRLLLAAPEDVKQILPSYQALCTKYAEANFLDQNPYGACCQLIRTIFYTEIPNVLDPPSTKNCCITM